MGAGDEVEERAEAPGGGFADKVEARDGGFEAASEDRIAADGLEGASNG